MADQDDGDSLGVLRQATPKVTRRQMEILTVYYDYYQTMGYPPTQREAVEKLGWACTTLSAYIEPLIRKGYLERTADRSNNLRPTPLLAESMPHLKKLQESMPPASATAAAKPMRNSPAPGRRRKRRRKEGV